MVRRHGKLIFLGLLLITFCGNLFAQKIPLTVPIDSLITVGYATGSLKTISGSVEKITERQMNKDQITNPLEAIRGRVPGLTIQRATNGPAALDAVRLRGTTSLTSGNDPLIIVDGVFGDLSMLTSIYPTDIESFTILKDASETAQYGSRGCVRCHRSHHEKRKARPDASRLQRQLLHLHRLQKPEKCSPATNSAR